MSELISNSYISSVINKVATACNLKHWEYLVEKLETKAQNYFGVLIPVLIKGKNNDENVVLKVMLKLAPTDDRYRVSGAVTAMFAREIFIYSKVFHIFQDLQQHVQSHSQFIIPKCYYVCKDYCKEVIAMQNMSENEYKPYVNSMFLDVDHLIISLKSLAKFHALSFILESKEADVFEEVTKTCLPLSENSNKRYIDILIDRLKKAIQKFESSSYVPLLKNLEHSCSTFIEAAYLSSEKNCLCHGDIWKENILFKYKDNMPISACLIDYQTVRMSSPAFDVLYLITSSTNSELRKAHFSPMLEIYYNTLIQFFTDAKIGLSIYSQCQFLNDLKIVGPACFIVANTALWLSSGLQEEGHVKSNQIWNTESEKAIAVEKYKAIIKGIIDDFIVYGYLKMISE